MIRNSDIAKNLMVSYDRIPDLTKPKKQNEDKGFLTRKTMPKNNNTNQAYAPLMSSVEQYQRIRNLRNELKERNSNG